MAKRTEVETTAIKFEAGKQSVLTALAGWRMLSPTLGKAKKHTHLYP